MFIFIVIILLIIFWIFKNSSNNSIQNELTAFIQNILSSFSFFITPENVKESDSLKDYFINFSQKRYPENLANTSEHKKHLKQRAFEYFLYENASISQNFDLILFIVVCLWIEDSPILRSNKYQNYSNLDFDIRSEINRIKECPFFNLPQTNSSVIKNIIDCLNLIYNEFISMREHNISEHIAGTSELLLCLSSFSGTYPKSSNPTSKEVFIDFVGLLYDHHDDDIDTELYYRSKAVIKAYKELQIPPVYDIPLLIISCFWIEKRKFLSAPDYSTIPVISKDIINALKNTFYTCPKDFSPNTDLIVKTLSFYDLTYNLFYSEQF